jgi:hypothetical protein
MDLWLVVQCFRCCAQCCCCYVFLDWMDVMNENVLNLIKESGLDYDELWDKDQLAVNKLIELVIKESVYQLAEAFLHCSGSPEEYVFKHFGIKE